jgi:group II intron reverse transcriptase/maturase
VKTLNIGNMQSKLARWSTDDKSRQFDRLLRLISTKEWLEAAVKSISKNPGFNTPGIDGVTGKQFVEKMTDNIDTIQAELRVGTYSPQPVRRVYIPKANGQPRPLGIPTIKDRVVQQAIKGALEPIWESDFLSNSYGFRPARSTHHAIRHVMHATSNLHVQSGRWIIEGDLARYFDTVHHKRLMRCLKRRVADPRLLRVIWKLLKSGVMEQNQIVGTSEGLPQGGILSPLLANIFLHEFDLYMNDTWTGDLPRRKISRQREKGLRIPSCSYVRYADDFVVVVRGTKADALSIRDQLRIKLELDLNLSMNMEKSHVTHIHEGIVFLGYQIQRQVTSTGKVSVITKIPKQKLDQFCAQLTKQLSTNLSEDPFCMLELLTQKIRGWLNYYQFATYSQHAKCRLSRLSFWKYGHWLAKKYRTRVSALMKQKRFYAVATGKTTINWVQYKQDKVSGKTREVSLISPWEIKNRHFYGITPKQNPFIQILSNRLAPTQG